MKKMKRTLKNVPSSFIRCPEIHLPTENFHQITERPQSLRPLNRGLGPIKAQNYLLLLWVVWVLGLHIWMCILLFPVTSWRQHAPAYNHQLHLIAIDRLQSFGGSLPKLCLTCSPMIIQFLAPLVAVDSKRNLRRKSKIDSEIGNT